MQNFLKKSLPFLKYRILFPFLDRIEKFPPFFTMLVLGSVGLGIIFFIVTSVIFILVALNALSPIAIPVLVIMGFMFELGWVLQIILNAYYNERR